MCSWCWGFSPVIESVREHFGGELPVDLLLGGLRPGTTQAMDDALKASIRGHWQHVHERTGQPFDFSFFDRSGFVYDTEPPSRAAVAVRRLDPGSVFGYLKRVHRAFYAENRDVTDGRVLRELASESGIDRDVFTEMFAAEETRRETLEDFAAARRLGINGFPALIAGRDRDGYEVIAVGYRPYDQVEGLIHSWLEG